MRRLTKLLPLVLVILVLGVGCPRLFGPKFPFTSADLGWGSWRGDGLFAPALDGAEGENEAGQGEPREVVEPDVIRRDGNLLYVLNQYRGLTIVDLDGQEILGRVPTYGYPRDLYVDGDRAYVLVGYALEYTAEDNTVTWSVQARLYVVDITDPADAGILATFDLDGDLVDSRLVGHVLYAVCAQYDSYGYGEAVPGGGGVVIREEVVKTKASESWITSVNIADPNNIYRADEQSFGGYGTVIQATDEAIYVAAPDWNDWRKPTTTITYVDISDPDGAMALRGDIEVNGYVADRFKMDAWNGVLRVVSGARRAGEPGVAVTTIDLDDPDNLVTLGEYFLEDAIGETLFATRFDGPRAYIVTYFVVDPLFVVDLSDPAAPSVTGMLEVPGWSTHIEPRGDRLIALGVDDTDGRRVSVSLFDVEDPANPLLADRIYLGDDWSWSSAYGDVKAFTVLDDLLIVPFSGWTDEAGPFDRLQFVSYTPELLTVHDYVDLEGTVLRSFEYSGAYYGVTTEQLATIDASNLDDLAVTNRVTLAENVADFVELSASVGIEVITSYETGETVVRTVGLPLKALGEVTVSIGQLLDTHLYGDTVVLVGTAWECENAALAPWCDWNSYYRVALVDCATPAEPQVVETLRIDVEPYYGYGDYWPLYGGLEDLAVAPRGEKQYASWWYPTDASDTTFLVGDILALRCLKTEWDTTFGEEVADQGLALIDLTVPAWTSTLGLGYEEIMSVDVVGDKLYTGTKRHVGYELGRPVCAYFVRELDVAGPSMGPSANVPGIFVQYDPDRNVLTLRDDQWVGLFADSHTSELRTVSWDGSGKATEIDSLRLPDNTWQVLGRGAKVYLGRYNDGFRLYAATVTPSGALSLGSGILVTEEWASLVDANGSTAYATVAGGAIACYDFSDGGGLVEVVPVMGLPWKICFGTDTAYAPLGYFGLVTLPL